MADAAPEPFGPDDFRRETGADDAAMARLVHYADLLTDWNGRMNLVSPASLADLWRRHMFDSAQLEPLIPADAHPLADLGSGAGFPGLVLAVLRPQLKVRLVESIEKKCAFLRAVVEALELPHVSVLRGRAEEIVPFKADVVTARAMAPLDELLTYAKSFVGKSTLLLFPKGRTAGDELTLARQSWTIDATMIPSRSDPSGHIVSIRSFAPKGRRP